MEGLYSGLGSGASLTATQLDIKMKLLVEAPAAVEDALASLLDHHDAMLQVLLHRGNLALHALLKSAEGCSPAIRHTPCLILNMLPCMHSAGGIVNLLQSS